MPRALNFHNTVLGCHNLSSLQPTISATVNCPRLNQTAESILAFRIYFEVCLQAVSYGRLTRIKDLRRL